MNSIYNNHTTALTFLIYNDVQVYLTQVNLQGNQHMGYERYQDKNVTKGKNVKTSCTTTGDNTLM